MVNYYRSPPPKGSCLQMVLVFILIVSLMLGHFEVLLGVVVLWIFVLKNKKEEAKRQIEEKIKNEHNGKIQEKIEGKSRRKISINISIEFNKKSKEQLEKLISRNDRPNANPNIITESQKEELEKQKQKLKLLENELLELDKGILELKTNLLE